MDLSVLISSAAAPSSAGRAVHQPPPGPTGRPGAGHRRRQPRERGRRQRRGPRGGRGVRRGRLFRRRRPDGGAADRGAGQVARQVGRCEGGVGGGFIVWEFVCVGGVGGRDAILRTLSSRDRLTPLPTMPALTSTQAPRRRSSMWRAEETGPLRRATSGVEDRGECGTCATGRNHQCVGINVWGGQLKLRESESV